MSNAVFALAIVTTLATLVTLSSWIANYPLRMTVRSISYNLKRILDALQPKLIDFKIVKEIFKKQNKLLGQTKDIMKEIDYLEYCHREFVDQQERILEKLEKMEAKMLSDEGRAKRHSFLDSNPDLVEFICRNQSDFKSAFDEFTSSGTWRDEKSRINVGLTRYGDCRIATQCWKEMLRTTLSNCETTKDFKACLLLYWMTFAEAIQNHHNEASV